MLCRNQKALGFFLVCSIYLLIPAGQLAAAVKEIPMPTPKDTCPVCGMFVQLYPEWIATVVYMDNSTDHFDGAKDLFKYLLDLKKWAPERNSDSITGIWVTDYYTLDRLDARKALYVIGSDVLGPMGHELIPLAGQEDAEEFSKDHVGKRILQFNEVTLPLLNKLDNGRFE